MAFSDVMHRLGRLIGLYSDEEDMGYDDGYDMQEYPEEEAPRAEYDDGGEYGYDEYPGYDEPAQEQQSTYQSAYSSGGSYVKAGAKPKAAPARTGRPAQEPSPLQGFFTNRTLREEAPAAPQRKQSSKVVPISGREENAPAAAPAANGGSTIIFCVRRKDDSSQIIEYLISGVHVILNFEEVDDVQCQRVLDMVSGAAFALRGSVERISHRNYLVAPSGVEIVRSETRAAQRGDNGFYAAR